MPKYDRSNAILRPWLTRTSPSWVTPTIAVVATGLALLTAFTDAPLFAPGAAPLLTNLGLLAYGLIMLLETAGLLRPRWLFLATTLPIIAYQAYLGRDTLLPLLAILVVWWATYTGNLRQGIVALILSLLSVLPPFLVGRGTVDNLISWTIGITMSWAAVCTLRLQQRTMAELRAAQADLAAQAVRDERRRIAREIHDVVAHSLSITLLHVTGARHVLARDPQRAAAALAQAETLGRRSLGDLRRTVALLADAHPDSLAPAPCAADIPALFDTLAQAEVPITHRIEGNLEGLGECLSLDLYRLTQEALTNATRHAPGKPVDVQISVGAETLKLEVRNPLAAGEHSATNHGRGVIGMRERVGLHDGTLAAGPENGTWRVSATIPIRTEN
jgi:signal transduction histidine kinase